MVELNCLANSPSSMCRPGFWPWRLATVTYACFKPQLLPPISKVFFGPFKKCYFVNYVIPSLLLTSIFLPPSYSRQTQCQTHIWGDHGCTSTFQTTYKKDQILVQFDCSSHTEMMSSWLGWPVSHGRLTGWELGNLGAVTVDTANKRQGRPGNELWDTNMLEPCKIPTPIPPKRVCLPSPFLVRLQSEPISVCILVVLHVLKAELGLWGGS